MYGMYQYGNTVFSSFDMQFLCQVHEVLCLVVAGLRSVIRDECKKSCAFSLSGQKVRDVHARRRMNHMLSNTKEESTSF